MTDKNICKQKFYGEVQRLLSKYPNQLKMFNDLWRTNEYRLAYSILEKILSENEIKLNDNYKKIDQDFYWLFIG